MKVACFLGSEIIGYAETDGETATHYFCTHCGRIWAKELPLDENPHHHNVFPRHCPEHWTGNAFRAPIFYNPHVPTEYDQEVLLHDFVVLVTHPVMQDS